MTEVWGLTVGRLSGLVGGMASILALLQVSPQALVGLLPLHHLHGVKPLQLLQLLSQVLKLTSHDITNTLSSPMFV